MAERLTVQKTFPRQFTPSDLEQVRHINQRCLPENYSSSFFLDLYKRFPETFIVVEKEEEIIGYILCRIERRLSDLRLIGIARKGHIISIAVLPEFQRQGIGYSLMQEAMNAMSFYKAEECVLEVRKNNVSALNLYKKLGLTITRTLYSYYADGADAYKMARKLPFES